ncbi:hypothetical protein HNR23_004751 [Nocardiopsis mwathae]|uniref:Uncharacterized protein n=1 Tax=Nocardiopsis mwathae TaxID=1472723 RepID=A0A7W9YNB8_9ACTN|nr:hypothetical protein [Nocardiopsis mwathae]
MGLMVTYVHMWPFCVQCGEGSLRSALIEELRGRIGVGASSLVLTVVGEPEDISEQDRAHAHVV